jgi:hypothetical protein
MGKGGSIRGVKESRCGTGRGDSPYGSGASLAVWQSTGEGRDYGKRVNRKNVARLIREKGLHASQRRKFIPTTRSNHGLPGCEHFLNREFQSGGWRERGICHYFPAYQGRRGYLTVILDGRSLAGFSVPIGRPFIRPFPPWKWPSLPGRVCSSTLTGRYRIVRKPFGFGSRKGVPRFARV